jgi:hypothetical protein
MTPKKRIKDNTYITTLLSDHPHFSNNHQLEQYKQYLKKRPISAPKYLEKEFMNKKKFMFVEIFSFQLYKRHSGAYL